MEPPKFSTTDLQLAKNAAMNIEALVAVIVEEPANADENVRRLDGIEEYVAKLITALRIVPKAVIHDIIARKRVAELESRCDELSAERADILAALPAGDARVNIPDRVREIVRANKEMAEELTRDVDPVDVIEAATVSRDPRAKSDDRASDRTVADLRAFAYIDVVFDGPPAPEAGRFVEVEDPRGYSVNVGDWIDRGNGLWALRITMPSAAPPAPADPAMPPRVAEAFAQLAAVVTTSALDWSRYPCLAFVYGVLVGHHVDALDDLQCMHGWPDSTIEAIERARLNLLAARGVPVVSSR